MLTDPANRLIDCGRGLSEELDKIIAEEEYQERAGILEYDAGYSRQEAEARALREIEERRRKERNS